MGVVSRIADLRSSLRGRRDFDPTIPSLPGIPGLAAATNFARFRHNAFDVLQRADAVGDIVRVDLLHKATCFVKHPDAIATMFDSQDIWQRGEGLVPLIGRNMLTTNGLEWSTSRHLAQPSFHPKMTERAADVFARAAAAELDDVWTGLAASSSDVDIAQQTVRLFARHATRAFGFDLRHDEAQRFPEVMQRLQRWAFSVVAGGQLRTPQVDADMGMLEGIIERGLATPPPPGEPPSYLERIRQDAQVDRATLVAQLMLTLIAPADNPPNAAAFTLWVLANNRTHEDALRREIGAVLGSAIPTADALERMPLLDRILQETLRMYPVVWMLLRFPKVDTELLGRRIPAATPVWGAPYFVHRHPRYWDEPNVFRPDRFLPDAVEKRHRHAYFPFGAGPRMCIGSRLATREARMMVAMFLQRFRFVPQSSALQLEGLFGLRAKGGLLGRIVPAEVV
jgi:cytochrome P450